MMKALGVIPGGRISLRDEEHGGGNLVARRELQSHHALGD